MLTLDEHERIRLAINTANKIPFIDDIEDYVWEAIWAYSQRLPVPPRDRSKRLYDVVDTDKRIGWSAKTLVWTPSAKSCEFVIQRVDVLKKRAVLGFPDLTIDSDPQHLGNAVLTHWRNKIVGDMKFQEVVDSRLALLIKSRNRLQLYAYEEPLPVPELDEVTWSWSSADRVGLLGSVHGVLKYRWYPNGKQLFETFDLEDGRVPINVNHDAFSVDELLTTLGSE